MPVFALLHPNRGQTPASGWLFVAHSITIGQVFAAQLSAFAAEH